MKQKKPSKKLPYNLQCISSNQRKQNMQLRQYIFSKGIFAQIVDYDINK